MGTVLSFLLGCAITFFVLAVPILGVVAFVRSRRLAREMEILRREVRTLRDRISEPSRAAEIRPVEPPAAAAPARAEPLPSARPSVTVAPPPPPPARPPPAPSLAAPTNAVDWERWIGVRGAAVVGGLVLALAAILFFKHSFERGWISPTLRVVLGSAASLAAIGGGWRLRRRGFVWAPSALEGAGIVGLYATIWASDKRYALISIVVSFPLMAFVTALACALAIRQRSLFTALLGLVGGFATPLLLSTGVDRPVSLFSYVLLLDLGLMLVGRMRRWPSIGLLALLGTFLMEGLWIFLRMGERQTLGLAIVALFAVTFSLAGMRLSTDERRRWRATQAFAVIFPFVFAFQFAGQIEFRDHVWPTALLLGLLAVAGALVARAQELPWLAHSSVAGGVAVVALWFLDQYQRSDEVLLELALVACGLALVAHALAEWEGWRKDARGAWRGAAAIGACSWLLLLVYGCAARRTEGFRPLFLGLLVLAALLVRQAVLLERGAVLVCAAAGLGLGLGFAHGGYGARFGDATLPDPQVFLALPAVLALAFAVLARRCSAGLARGAWHALATLLVSFALLAVIQPIPGYLLGEPWSLPACAALYGPLILLAAVRLGSTPWVAACTLVTALLALLGWIALRRGPPSSEETQLLTLGATLLGPAAVIALAGWWGRALSERRWAWAALAALGPSVLFAAKPLFSLRFGDGFEAGSYLLLALPYGLAVALQRRGGATSATLGWMAGAEALLLAGAVADQLDHEELAVGAALGALGLAFLARTLVLPAAGWTAAALSCLLYTSPSPRDS